VPEPIQNLCLLSFNQITLSYMSNEMLGSFSQADLGGEGKGERGGKGGNNSRANIILYNPHITTQKYM
jgi:hypothetical protein